jgi:hypothetical protein
MMAFVVDEAALGQVSSRYRDFPCHSFIPLIGPQSLSSSIIQGRYSRPINGRSISGLTKSRRMRWAGHVVRMGEKRNVYRLLVGKPEGKRPLGRPRRRWIDNIKMDLLEIGLNVVDWIGLAQDRYRRRALVNSVMNLRVP